MPEAVRFATKPAIALALIEQARGAGPLPDIVVADAGYGVDTAFRDRLSERGFVYVVGITGAVSLWPAGQAPLLPKRGSGRGRKPKLLRRDPTHKPLSAKTPAMQLPARCFRSVTWPKGTNRALRSRFAAVRVRCATRDYWRSELRPAQWLLIEWPKGEAEPTKYFLSTLPAATPIKELVRFAKLGFRIERDYQELKQGLGLGHFEGRSWRGFHHHATLCIAAYGFLLAERLAGPKKLCATRYWAKSLPYPKTSGPAAPLRRQRHVPDPSPRCASNSPQP